MAPAPMASTALAPPPNQHQAQRHRSKLATVFVGRPVAQTASNLHARPHDQGQREGLEDGVERITKGVNDECATRRPDMANGANRRTVAGR